MHNHPAGPWFRLKQATCLAIAVSLLVNSAPGLALGLRGLAGGGVSAEWVRVAAAPTGGGWLDESAWDDDKPRSGNKPPAPPTGTKPGSPSGTSPGTSTSQGQRIGSTGGETESADGSVRISVPPGALTRALDIRAQPIGKYPGLDDPPTGVDVQVGAAVELGPSGTRFAEPVEVTVRISAAARDTLERGGLLEVGFHDGQIWRRIEDARYNGDGTVTFRTRHFSPFLTLTLIGVLGLTGLAFLAKASTLATQPYRWITPEAQGIKDHVRGGRVRLPHQINDQGYTSLGLGRGFEPYGGTRVNHGNGEDMLAQETANCQEISYFTASLLRATKDPRFQRFIGVQGTAVDPQTGEKVGHMWIEIEVDGRIYVVDTANTRDISLLPKDEAYRKYQLNPAREFSDLNRTRTKYKGLGSGSAPTTPAGTTTTPATPAEPDAAAVKAAYDHGCRVGRDTPTGNTDMRQEYAPYLDQHIKLRESFRKGYAECADQTLRGLNQ